MNRKNLKSIVKYIDRCIYINDFPVFIKFKEGSWIRLLKGRYERLGFKLSVTRDEGVLNSILLDNDYNYDTSNDEMYGIFVDKKEL